MNKSLRLKVSLIGLLFTCILLASIVIKNAALPQQNYQSFDPKDYGIPNQIGGYDVIAVVPSESMACSKAGRINLILRAIPNQPQTLTDNDLQKIENNVHSKIGVTINSGTVTMDSIQNQVDSWNKEIGSSDCLPIGRQMITVTPHS